MPWIITSPPSTTWANTQVGMNAVLAIRMRPDTGETEFLLAAENRPPEWVSTNEIEGIVLPDRGALQ